MTETYYVKNMREFEISIEHFVIAALILCSLLMNCDCIDKIFKNFIDNLNTTRNA